MAKLNFAEQTFGTGKSWNVISQCHNCRFRVKYVNFVIKPSAQTRRPTPCHLRFIRLSSITGHLLIPRREATRAGDVLHTTGQTLTIIRTDSAWPSFGQAHKHRSGVGRLNCRDSRSKCLTIFMVVIYLGRRRNTCNYASITLESWPHDIHNGHGG